MRLIVSLLLLFSMSGCAGVQQLAALRKVEFRFDRIGDPHVAGIALDDVRSVDDVSASELARLTLAIASDDVPLDLEVHVVGTNPETNTVTAKLIGLDWSYIVDGREAVSGKVTESYEFPPGNATDVELPVTFNLMDLLGGTGEDLLDSALALAGVRASTHRVTVELRPLIDTPMGPMRYPSPIELVLAAGAR